MATAVKALGRAALETLVRDEKSSDENGFPKPQIEGKSLHVQDLGLSETLVLSGKVFARLLELHEKGIDVNELLNELLDRREEEIAREKEEIAKTSEETGSLHSAENTTKSRIQSI